MKILRVYLIISLLLLLQSCSPSIDKNANTAVETEQQSTIYQITTPSDYEELHISDLFVIKDNLKLTYQGYGNEFASLTVYTDYTDKSRVQYRTDNGATVILDVLEVGDGKLTKLLSVHEGYYRENLIPSAPDTGEVLLAEPICTGNSWTLSDGRIRTITDTSAQLTTPSGSYTTVEVTTKDPDGCVKDYYAPGAGLVKTVFAKSNFEVSSSLVSIEDEGIFTQKINFFFPLSSDGKNYYVTKDISFKTNDDTRLKLTELYSIVPDSGFVHVFSADTSINSLYLNKDGMVYIDLNSSFVSDMNVGAEMEQNILQCVANTVGTYYGVQKVILTIDNKPYSSKHIEMQTDEYLTVSIETTQWER